MKENISCENVNTMGVSVEAGDVDGTWAVDNLVSCPHDTGVKGQTRSPHWLSDRCHKAEAKSTPPQR